MSGLLSLRGVSEFWSFGEFFLGRNFLTNPPNPLQNSKTPSSESKENDA